MDCLDYVFGLAALAYIVTSTMFAAVRWWHTCPTLDKNYAYPDRRMQVLLYLVPAVVLAPCVAFPMQPSAQALPAHYFVLCHSFFCALLLMTYFGQVLPIPVLHGVASDSAQKPLPRETVSHIRQQLQQYVETEEHFLDPHLTLRLRLAIELLQGEAKVWGRMKLMISARKSGRRHKPYDVSSSRLIPHIPQDHPLPPSGAVPPESHNAQPSCLAGKSC